MALNKHGTFPALPSYPLYKAVIGFRDPHEETDVFGARMGTSGKSLREWGVLIRTWLHFDTADMVIAQSPLSWWDVYNEDTVREYAFAAITFKPRRDKRMASGFVHERTAAKFYGDLGPDWVALEKVRLAFECSCPNHVQVDPECTVHGDGFAGDGRQLELAA